MKNTFLITLLLLINTNFCYCQTVENDVVINSPQNPATDPIIKQMILKESKKGGKLDFFTPIKGKEYDGFQIKPGIYETKIGWALIQWGKANYEAGVGSLEDAFSIYSEFRKKPINEIEKTYIKIGFNRELDK